MLLTNPSSPSWVHDILQTDMSLVCPSFQTRGARGTRLTASSIADMKLVPACKTTIYMFSTVINNFPYGTVHKLMCQLLFDKSPCLNNQLSYPKRILSWSYLGASCTAIHCWWIQAIQTFCFQMNSEASDWGLVCDYQNCFFCPSKYRCCLC